MERKVQQLSDDTQYQKAYKRIGKHSCFHQQKVRLRGGEDEGGFSQEAWI